MLNDDKHFFRNLKTRVDWCERAKKFTACGMSTRQSGEMLVYILNHLIKNAWGAVFMQYMCIIKIVIHFYKVVGRV